MRGAQGYFLKNFKKVRKSQVAGIEKIVMVGVSGLFKGRGVVTDRHRSTSRILRNRCPPVVDVGLVGEVFPVARRRVELLHGQRVFRCGLPHARRHVVLVVARVSVVAVRRVRGVISRAAVLLSLGVFVPALVRVDLVDGLPGRHRAVVAVLGRGIVGVEEAAGLGFAVEFGAVGLVGEGASVGDEASAGSAQPMRPSSAMHMYHPRRRESSLLA